MIKLTKLDKFLIRLGIVTNNYKEYAKSLQKELDYEHLSSTEYLDKYYGEWR